jgi:hypothetical protein
MEPQTKISAAALAELESALGRYNNTLAMSELSPTSQAIYFDHANCFVRWLRGEFEPGSQVAPYAPKKKR